MRAEMSPDALAEAAVLWLVSIAVEAPVELVELLVAPMVLLDEGCSVEVELELGEVLDEYVVLGDVLDVWLLVLWSVELVELLGVVLEE
jgi:hypothetical protein